MWGTEVGVLTVYKRMTYLQGVKGMTDVSLIEGDKGDAWRLATYVMDSPTDSRNFQVRAFVF